jgi:uncharacterized protein (DUF885 family)
MTSTHDREGDTLVSRSRVLQTGYLIIAGLALAACADKGRDEDAATEAAAAAATASVNTIATEFVDAYYAQFPEEVYEVGYPDAPMDRFGDHSTASIAAWNRQVDGWLEQLRSIDATVLAGTAANSTYGFARERMEAIAARRVCKMDWWNISPTWTGWQPQLVATLAVQPVATPEEKSDALARLADVARYLETETEILREGMQNDYLAANSNVAAVLRQTEELIATPTEESPFFDPASRSDDAEFANKYQAILEDEVHTALKNYRDFLAGEYQGRDKVGVSANPNGHLCYKASVRYHSSLQISPEDIHRAGLSEMSRIQTEMHQIARESFGTEDLKGLLETLRTDPEYTFDSEEAVLEYARAAVARGKAEVGNWFGYVPDAPMIVKPSPAYEQDSGGGFYSSGSVDGSRPGTYQVGTYNPQGISKAGMEATAFHESYPGHHMQMAIALFNEDLHSILRFMYISGTGEGWALYTEKLADEMGLYSSEMSRLGMLSNEAFRAARLVVDPGMHVMGWTREEAIEYMLEHTAEGYNSVASEVDRYIAVPGQATSYLLGSLEIQRLRRSAEEKLGEQFDIKAFHDLVIANGNVSLPMLGAAVNTWIAHRLPEHE